MRSCVLALVAVMLVLTARPALAQKAGGRSATQPAADEARYEADRQAIRKTAEAFTQAFNRGDAKALAAMWTQDGEYIDEVGTVIRGRAAIEGEFAAFFKQRPEVRMQVAIDSIRFLGPTAAIEEGVSRLSDSADSDLSAARYTVLHVKENGQWLMASVRDRESAPLSNYATLKALEPLVGSWTARSGNARVETSCRWVENRNFILRKFTTYRGDKAVGGGIEIIGIDPGLGQITSWHFSDDGGVGRSVWKKEGARWIIQASGTTPNGASTSATDVLTPVDRDTFTWASYDRLVEGEPVQELPVVKVERNKK